MHFLHKILVYIPECECKGKAWDEKKEEIISYAESQTENFYGDVFDWRETESAGRWANVYPDQAYLASNDIEWFVKELNITRESQELDIKYCLMEIKNSCGLNLEDICKNLLEIDNGPCSVIAYYLYHVSEVLCGHYCAESNFYNSYDSTARIYDSTIEKVRKEPHNWALVMFDYHN